MTVMATHSGDVSKLLLALVAAGSALAGVLLQSVAGYFTDRRAEKREQRMWVRDKRFEAYSGVIVGLTEVASAAEDGDLEEANKRLSAVIGVNAHADFVSTLETSDALHHLYDDFDAGLSRRLEPISEEAGVEDMYDAIMEMRRVLKKLFGFNKL